jgi:hypothetical protein
MSKGVRDKVFVIGSCGMPEVIEVGVGGGESD